MRELSWFGAQLADAVRSGKPASKPGLHRKKQTAGRGSPARPFVMAGNQPAAPACASFTIFCNSPFWYSSRVISQPPISSPLM